MKVVFRTNLGSIDAKKFGLDHKKCQLGSTAEVNESVAEALTKSGLAVPAEKASSDDLISSFREEEQRDKEVRGEAKKPSITAPAK